MLKVDIKLNDLYKAIGQIKAHEVEKLQAVRDATNEAAINVQTGAKDRALVDTGRLRSSIVKEPVGIGGMRFRVGTNVEYARAVEYGTKPHVIRPKNKKALYWKGAAHPVKQVKHPGTKARPFLFPAWEEERPKYIERLKKVLGK